MTQISKAVYLGNIEKEYHGFTIGNIYEVERNGGRHIIVTDDNGSCRNINNGAFHNFKICEDGYGFVTENECAVKASRNDKKPELRYYINGYEVDKTEFWNVRYTVIEFDEFGVKCDTIKFEVKFE